MEGIIMVRKHSNGGVETPPTTEQVLELFSKLAAAGKVTAFSKAHVQWMIDNISMVGPYFEYFMETRGIQDVELITNVFPGCETKQSLSDMVPRDQPETWIETMKQEGLLEVMGNTNIFNPKLPRMHDHYHLLLLHPKLNRGDVVKEFAIRNCVPATPVEMISLLHSLRGSSKACFPFVSIAGPEKVVATAFNGDPVHAISESEMSSGYSKACIDVNLPWSYVGAMRN